VVVLDTAGGLTYLESFTARAGGGYDTRGRLAVGQFPDGQPYLQPEIEGDGADAVTRLVGPDADRAYLGRALLPMRTSSYDDPEAVYVPVFAAPANPGQWRWVGRLIVLDPDDDPRLYPAAPLPWQPAHRSGFAVPPLDWARPRSQALELVGVAEDDAVYWSEVRRDGAGLAAATATRPTPGGYRAACLTGPGLVAAVTGDNQVHWLRADGSPVLRPWATPRKLPHPAAAVFVAHRPQGNEVVVVFADGWAVRVAKP
jgi:hypothetical protein